MALGHSQWLWPLAMATGRAHGHLQRPLAQAMGQGAMLARALGAQAWRAHALGVRALARFARARRAGAPSLGARDRVAPGTPLRRVIDDKAVAVEVLVDFEAVEDHHLCALVETGHNGFSEGQNGGRAVRHCDVAPSGRGEIA